VLAQLRLGVQPAAGVIEVHVTAPIQAREIAARELVEQCRVGIAGIV